MDESTVGTGPLEGLRVVELGGLGPSPHAGMVLADLGADVVRIDRKGGSQLGEPDASDAMLRGRRRVDANLKTGAGHKIVLKLVANADVLLEGYRPGVMERLLVGPQDCLEVNPRLIYARVTGWGQDGPWAARAGHDLNYMSITGALHALGEIEQCPPPPLNMVGDYGGGSMLVLTGILAALWSRDRTGVGQVVDAAMVDGVSTLAQKVWSLRAQNHWNDERSSNSIDGGSPWYRTYRCADGKFVAVAAIEPKFYAELLAGLGLTDLDLPAQHDRAGYPQITRVLEGAFAMRTRDEWSSVFADRDACMTPVLSWEEVSDHPHIAQRGTIIMRQGIPEAAPAPRFSHTPTRVPGPMHDPIDVDLVLKDWIGNTCES